MCDVDDNRAANGYKMFPNARKFKDFRVMFDQMANEIDAVIITTPDHTPFCCHYDCYGIGYARLCGKALGTQHLAIENPQKSCEILQYCFTDGESRTHHQRYSID